MKKQQRPDYSCRSTSMSHLKWIVGFVFLCLFFETEAQYFYINDVGTSTLNLSNAKDVKLSSSLFIEDVNFLNIGYSPVKHLGIYAGLYSNKLNEGLPESSLNSIKVKGTGLNAAIGFYHFLESPTAGISQKKGRTKGGLFYPKFGCSLSGIKNEFSTRGEFLTANFQYYKLYFELGMQLILKDAKIDFNFRNTYINFSNGEFIGDVDGEFVGYFDLISENFSESSLFTESELNIQGEIGRGYITLISGIFIFFPKVSDKPRIIYRRNRPLYIGVNIDIDDCYNKLRGT